MKRALIIFPDEWLRYSPSMINLVTCLSDDYEVHVLAGDNDHFNNAGIVPNLTLVKCDTKSAKYYRKLGKYKEYKTKRIKKALANYVRENRDFDLVFAVDSLGYLLARAHFNKVVFFSLEISKDEAFDKCLQLGIDHMIIQSKERYRYLFGDQETPHSFIQNAPILTKIYPPKSPGKKILYMGNVDYKYGIEAMLNGVLQQQSYTITLKGFYSPKFMDMLKSQYAKAIEEGFIRFHFDYTPQEEIIEFIRQYDIGVTGYDMELAREDYNYYSSPAGKLFNYYAAGLPVLGVAIDGLKSVVDYKAGVLVSEMSVEEVTKALQNIEQDYHLYTKNSLKAAVDFDFKKGFENFMNNWEIQHG